MSENIPRPEPLAERIAEVLRDRIMDRRYGETLPGEPRLATQLGVARGSLRKALDVLANEGWISSSEIGVARRILPIASKSKVRRTRSVGVLLPFPLDTMPSGTQHFLRDLAAISAADGITLIHHPSVAAKRDHPGKLLKTLLAEQPADLWLLYEASKPVAQFFKSAGVPAIICGGSVMDEGLSYCGFDGLAAARHAIGVFSRAGHTQIVSASRFRRPHREQVFREEFAKRGLSFDLNTHMPCWNWDLEQLHQLLRSRLSSPDRPTAWMINGLEGLVVMFSTLMELGLRVPQDISVLTIGSDPMLGCFRPAISHYSTPHGSLAVAIARMIRIHLKSPPAAPVLKLLQTEFVPGGTVGPLE